MKPACFFPTPGAKYLRLERHTLLSPGIKLGKTRKPTHSRQGFPQIYDLALCLSPCPGPIGSSARAELGVRAGREVITEEKHLSTECMAPEAGERPTEQNLQAWPQGPAPLSPILAPQCPNPKCPQVVAKTREPVQTGPRGSSEEGAQAWSGS